MSTFWDTHVHLFSHRHIKSDLYFGRHRLPRWAWPIIKAIHEVIDHAGDIVPDHVEALVETALAVFRLDDDARRIGQLIRLFYTPVDQQLAHLQAEWTRLGIAGGYVLIPAVGDYRRATRDICAAAVQYDNVKVFAPWECAHLRGVFGIKYYPALSGRQGIAEMGKMRLPIIAHCSGGGIRADGVTLAQARKYNRPGWVHDVVDVWPEARIVLAHGGGRAEFLKTLDTAKDTPIKNLLRNTSDFGPDWPGAFVAMDTAFHEHQTRSDYMNAIAQMDGLARGRVLLGSDHPLMLSGQSYADWARDTREAWGWGLDEVEAARVRFEGEK
jgi:hypothetical protein